MERTLHRSRMLKYEDAIFVYGGREYDDVLGAIWHSLVRYGVPHRFFEDET